MKLFSIWEDNTLLKIEMQGKSHKKVEDWNVKARTMSMGWLQISLDLSKFIIYWLVYR